MLVVKLREAMARYRIRKGTRITYDVLAEMTGIAVPTLRAIGSRLGYHPTLANIEKLCVALELTPGELLEIIDDPPKPKRKAKRTRAGGTGGK
ncbi:MAG: helix-turn-helix transcriptional regulator [Phycisphaerales bacterium]|nr:MAG: helix-turn-helix transcriptional regulator [Phycisphaerales bacterium]